MILEKCTLFVCNRFKMYFVITINRLCCNTFKSTDIDTVNVFMCNGMFIQYSAFQSPSLSDPPVVFQSSVSRGLSNRLTARYCNCQFHYSRHSSSVLIIWPRHSNFWSLSCRRLSHMSFLAAFVRLLCYALSKKYLCLNTIE